MAYKIVLSRDTLTILQHEGFTDAERLEQTKNLAKKLLEKEAKDVGLDHVRVLDDSGKVVFIFPGNDHA